VDQRPGGQQARIRPTNDRGGGGGRLLHDGAAVPPDRMHDTDVLAIYPSRRHLSAKVRVMVDFLAAAFHGVAPWDRGLPAR